MPIRGRESRSRPEKPPFWKAPSMWDGGQCFILGGGPSLTVEQVESLRGRRVIAVNQAYKLGDWIDVLFFGD